MGMDFTLTKIEREKSQHRAYQLFKRTRMKWGKIAKKVGYCNANAAMHGAMSYALREGIEWPLGEPLCRGEVAYTEYQLSGDWDEVRKCLNLYCKNKARNAAFRWAKKKGKPWPIQRRSDGSE